MQLNATFIKGSQWFDSIGKIKRQATYELEQYQQLMDQILRF